MRNLPKLAVLMVVCAALVVVLSSAAPAALLFVKTDGDDANDGSSWELAKKTVQAAIDAAIADDEIWVAAGEYRERITLKDGVALYGGFAGAEVAREERDWRANVTKLNAQQGGSVVTAPSDVTSSSTRIDGFTICNGFAADGAGVLCSGSSPTIENNVLTENSAVNGGAIHCSDSAAPTIVNNVFKLNSASGEGGAIACYSGSSPTIANNLMHDNYAVHSGGAVFAYASDVKMSNNTIARNQASWNSGVDLQSCTAVRLSNNIVAFNSQGGVFLFDSPYTMRNNNFFGNSGFNCNRDPSGTLGNISQDPKFLDAGAKDFRLAAGSPCIDAGWNLALGLPALDLNGQARIAGGTVDMGAYEFAPLEITITSPTTADNYETTTNTLDIAGTAVGNVKEVNWASDRGFSGKCTGTADWTASGIILLVGKNVITVTATGTDGGQATDVLNVTYTETVPPVVTKLFVKTNGSNENDGSSWALAKRTIQAAIDAAVAGNEIWVAAGEYAERITLKNGVAIYGGFAGTELTRADRDWRVNVTKLNGGQEGTVVSAPSDVTSSSTRIDGFTICNGFATDGAGLNCTGSSPTIENNFFTQNSAANGGAILCSDSAKPTIVNNIFTLNSASGQGGAIACYSGSSPTIANNLMYENVALQSGGGVFAYSSDVKMSNNTIAQNQGAWNAGVDLQSCTSVSLSNNIVAFNSYGGVFLSDSRFTMRNNNFFGNTGFNCNRDPAGTLGNISQDPKFANPNDTSAKDFRLAEGSPCIDAGWNLATGLPSTDLSGLARISGGTVDMGAYEFYSIQVTITAPTKKDAYETNSDKLDIAGKATGSVKEVRWANDRGFSGLCTGTKDWKASKISLLVGRNIIRVTATGTDGSQGQDFLIVTYVDNTPPSVIITRPTSLSSFTTTATTINIGGTAKDNVGVASVKWTTDRGASGTCTGTTAWSAEAIPLEVGRNVITVTAADDAGNTATDMLTVQRVDRKRPTVVIEAPTADPSYTTTVQTLDIAGTASDDVALASVAWVNSRGGKGTCEGTENWQATGIKLYAGTNYITVTATDTSGNRGSDKLTVTYKDTTPPEVAITSPTTDPTYVATTAKLDIRGTASDNTALKVVTWANSAGGSGTCSGTTSWLAKQITLQSGENVITITAKDKYGNSATAVLTVTYAP